MNRWRKTSADDGNVENDPRVDDCVCGILVAVLPVPKMLTVESSVASCAVL